MMDKDFLDNLRTSQESEQQLAAMKQLAQVMRVYYLELREQGFSMVEAIQITIGWQAAIIDLNRPQK